MSGRTDLPRGVWAAAQAAALALALAACDQMPSLPGSEDRTAESEESAPATPPDRPQPDSLGPAAGAEVAALYQGEFEGFGMEPDWQLNLLDGWAALNRTGLEEIAGIPGARDVRARGAMVEAGPLVITLVSETCVYADQQLPYKVSVFFEGVTYEGCGRRSEPGAGGASAPANWAARLPELMPAISACLARAADATAITIAYELEGGAVAVRLRDRDGGRYECEAPADGSPPAGLDPIGDRNVLPGEREPTFYPAPDTGPSGQCYLSQPAIGADGAVLGTLVRRMC